MNDTRSGYDLVADRYAAEIGDELDGKPLDRALLDAVAELAATLPGDAPVLDVGCGPGHVTAHLAGREHLAGRKAAAFGLDLSPAMCAVAHRRTALPFGAADMTALPLRSGSVAGIVCLYAVIHCDERQRTAAYREFARVLRPGGYALVAFHTSDADIPPGGTRTLTDWWGHAVRLDFRFLDPAAESDALVRAGFELTARLDREPYAGVEHPSQRAYLLARRR
ncbi:class I SAM-dependent methyltransferase [Rugosimonospora africana]|uniref:Methyltransferase n=1 Tax=Rugosimonospora africana TaxID=556532 RepID=A0A8J3VP87_9ACTN|nr:class I SAM-dependent methyltransferase [Rugosimonospora africana]GIH13899.1 methyltransferase [Rugosimonospora africana]